MRRATKRHVGILFSALLALGLLAHFVAVKPDSFSKEGAAAIAGVASSARAEKARCPDLSDASIFDNLLHLIDRTYGLPSEYVPSTLIDLSVHVRTNGTICLREVAAESLVSMFRAAEAKGVHLGVTSGFRTAARQKTLFHFWLSVEGADAPEEIAEPGHSEHQLGTAVDLTGKSIGYASVDPRFGDSKEGVWLRENSSRYGFVMSYPKGKKVESEYNYEPWHFRYVGPFAATEIVSAGATPRTFLRKQYLYEQTIGR
ncbi:MAG: M15 family metallopeptidase [Patescibacteria group bacterium]